MVMSGRCFNMWDKHSRMHDKKDVLQLTVRQLYTLEVTVVSVKHLVAPRRPLQVWAEAHPLLRHRVGGVLHGCTKVEGTTISKVCIHLILTVLYS